MEVSEVENGNIILGSRIFCFEDQEEFGLYSGDLNPIHVDNIKSRKTIAGEVIVHGIHSFLWALELFLKRNSYIPSYYEISFRKKIILNKRVRCLWGDNKNEINIVDDENKLVSIKYKAHFSSYTNNDGLPLKIKRRLNKPLNPDDNYLKDFQSINSEYGGDIKYGLKIFPNLCKYVGSNIIYEIALISNIIGMQVPGFSSLSSYYKISIKRQDNNTPKFDIKNFNEQLRLINLNYYGRNIKAELQAFALKRSPDSSLSKGIKNKLYGINTYKNMRVLIIGGSRGIGSFLAKVIALLGGKVTISYFLCYEEASDVCNDINSNLETSTNYVKFDVRKDDYSATFTSSYDYLFYFATPKIFSKESNDFDEKLYKNFKKIYHDSFKKIALSFINKGGRNIFYPSDIALENNIKGLEEYKLAKQDGERVCNEISEKYSVKILIDRLERVDTDQSLTLIPVKALHPYDAAINIAKKMSSI